MQTSVERVTDLPGAASVTLQPLLEGPPRTARVLGTGPAALFLITDPAPRASPTVLALCTYDAVRLPLAMVVGAGAVDSPWAGQVCAGDAVRVGAGCVRLRGMSIHVARWWAPARPHPVDHEWLALATPMLLRLLSERAVALPGAASTNLRCLRRSLATGDQGGARRAVDAMLGLGPGLTPAGDDAIAGLLLAVRHLGGPGLPGPALFATEQLGAYVVMTAPGRTTAVSAALLGLATQGHAAPQVIAVLDALATGCGLPGALSGLLRLGHTSGGDLALGVAAGARLVVRQVTLGQGQHPGQRVTGRPVTGQ